MGCRGVVKLSSTWKRRNTKERRQDSSCRRLTNQRVVATITHDMNIKPLMDALANLEDAAHMTFEPQARREIEGLAETVRARLQWSGVFVGTKQPDEAPDAQRSFVNIASEVLRLFQHGPHFTPEQNRALASLAAAGEKVVAMQNENESWRLDSHNLERLIAQIEKALPNFKGLPAPTDWARVALQELIEQRDELLSASKALLEFARSCSLHTVTTVPNAVLQCGAVERAIGRVDKSQIG